jgi:hypothetical protein
VSGLLDMLRAAVVPAAAARAGYQSGQRDLAEERKKDDLVAATQARQSRLDQMKQRLDEAQATRDEAEAQWYRTRPTEPKAEAPHTVSAAEGIMRWDPATKTFKPTGLHTPTPAGERPEVVARREARESRMETQGALSGVQHQMGETRQEMKDLPNDPANDSDATFTSRMGQLRQRYDSLNHVSDSLNGELKKPTGGAGMSRVQQLRGALPTATGGVAAPAANPAQAEYDRATAAYQAKLASATTPADRQAATELYNRVTAAIARKHGQVPE